MAKLYEEGNPMKEVFSYEYGFDWERIIFPKPRPYVRKQWGCKPE